MPGGGIGLHELSPDTLAQVLSLLGPTDLASIACACRQLRSHADSPLLWERFAKARWAHPNYKLFPRRLPAEPITAAAPVAAAAAAAAAAAGTKGNQAAASTAVASAAAKQAGCDVAPVGPLPASQVPPRQQDQQLQARAAHAAMAACALPAQHADWEWKRLCGADNGWAKPCFGGTVRLCLPPPDDYVTAISMAHMHAAAACGASLAVVLAGKGLLQARSVDTGQLLGSRRISDDAFVYSIEQLSESGLFAAGDDHGAIRLLRMAAPGERPSGAGESLLPDEVPHFWGRSAVASLQYSAERGQLVALHDGMLHAHVAQPRNVLRVVDAERQATTGWAHELLDAYELVAACDISDPPRGAEFVAGSVHAGICWSCWRSGLPSLCCHKAHAHTAALCVFDVRASCTMAARYSTHHRSLFPRLLPLRQHYLLSSHVGQPLCCWDMRYMSTPVYEEQRLGNFSAGGVYNSLPFPPPSRGSNHQALFLDGNEDVLLGRAENGLMWLFDLSVCLGWQRPLGAANGGRSSSAAVAASAGRGGSWQRVFDLGFNDFSQGMNVGHWPQPLGALPCDTGLNPCHIVSERGGTSLVALVVGEEGAVGPEVELDAQIEGTGHSSGADGEAQQQLDGWSAAAGSYVLCTRLV